MNITPPLIIIFLRKVLEVVACAVVNEFKGYCGCLLGLEVLLIRSNLSAG